MKTVHHGGQYRQEQGGGGYIAGTLGERRHQQGQQQGDGEGGDLLQGGQSLTQPFRQTRFLWGNIKRKCSDLRCEAVKGVFRCLPHCQQPERSPLPAEGSHSRASVREPPSRSAEFVGPSPSYLCGRYTPVQPVTDSARLV